MILPGIIAGAAFGESSTPVDQTEQPHRYWRLLIAGGAGTTSLAKIEMAESSGGADVAPGNTLITLGSWTNPSNLFDGVDSTFAFMSSPTRTSPKAAGMDFGASSANWPVIREIEIRNRHDINTQNPLVFAVQYSDDNTTWSDAWHFVANIWTGAGQNQTFLKYTVPLVVFDVQSPPTDAGPNAVTLTATGDATVSGGRFVFDGVGDYYSNTAIPLQIYRMPWKFEVELGQVLMAAGGFGGILCVGGTSSRFLIIESAGAVRVYLDTGGPFVQSTTLLNNTTPRDIKVRLDGPNLSLFIDGVLEDTDSVAWSTNTTDDIYLGVDPFNIGARAFNGSFESVKITHI